MPKGSGGALLSPAYPMDHVADLEALSLASHAGKGLLEQRPRIAVVVDRAEQAAADAIPLRLLNRRLEKARGSRRPATRAPLSSP